jgi:hypothetical protein
MTKVLLLAIVGAAAAYAGLPSYFYAVCPKADKSSYECPWRPNHPEDPDEKAKRGEYGKLTPVIIVIQLLDSGELVNRCQWTDALYGLVKV